jgi:hypothetical protein
MLNCVINHACPGLTAGDVVVTAPSFAPAAAISVSIPAVSVVMSYSPVVYISDSCCVLSHQDYAK